MCCAAYSFRCLLVYGSLSHSLCISVLLIQCRDTSGPIKQVLTVATLTARNMTSDDDELIKWISNWWASYFRVSGFELSFLNAQRCRSHSQFHSISFNQLNMSGAKYCCKIVWSLCILPVDELVPEQRTAVMNDSLKCKLKRTAPTKNHLSKV